MTEYLKPCPFCGGDPIVCSFDNNPPLLYRIHCSSCQSSTTKWRIKDEIVKHWNIRSESKSGWISVKDRLPNELQEVVFFYTIDDHKKDIVCGHLESGIWYICYLYHSVPLNSLVNVTHWMPLPEMPE